MRVFEFPQDILEQKWGGFWAVCERETDQCYEIPRVLND